MCAQNAPQVSARPAADPSLVARFAAALPGILADIEALVTCESPSEDLAAVACSADVLAAVGQRHLGVAPERMVVEGRTHLRWRLGDVPGRVLVLGHHDTVWPIGSLRSHPFSVRDGVLRGPGSLDMKAGLVMALHALAALGDVAGVTLLVTGDEEIGSPSSRRLIEEESRGRVAAFVLEAAGEHGALKRARKGVSNYVVKVTGRAAHAGLEPESGVNASVELAHQVLAVAGLSDPAAGTTVTPTVFSAGTTANTVPADGKLAVDVRAWSVGEQQRVDTAMHALRPFLPEAGLEVTGGPNRPPLEEPVSAGLFDRAMKFAEALGIGKLRGASVGGGSDGNLTASVGTPTLDGLGAVGGGAHADHEHVSVADLPRRTALLTALIGDALDRPVPGSRQCAAQASPLTAPEER